jgi:hypothetical protein
VSSYDDVLARSSAGHGVCNRILEAWSPRGPIITLSRLFACERPSLPCKLLSTVVLTALLTLCLHIHIIITRIATTMSEQLRQPIPQVKATDYDDEDNGYFDSDFEQNPTGHSTGASQLDSAGTFKATDRRQRFQRQAVEPARQHP